MSSHRAAAVPPRWLRTLPWLAGLLIGATAHVVWWSHAWSEPVIVQVESPAPPAPTEVWVHADLPGSEVSGSPSVADRSRASRITTPRSDLGVRGAVVCSGNGCTIRRSFLERLLDDPRMVSRTVWRRGVEPDGSANLTVEGVYPGSVAEVLGLRDGDTILALNGQPLGYSPEPGPPGGPLSTGDTLSVTLRRQGKLETFHYTLIDE